jgi:hypothetical protein
MNHFRRRQLFDGRARPSRKKLSNIFTDADIEKLLALFNIQVFLELNDAVYPQNVGLSTEKNLVYI